MTLCVVQKGKREQRVYVCWLGLMAPFCPGDNVYARGNSDEAGSWVEMQMGLVLSARGWLDCLLLFFKGFLFSERVGEIDNVHE